MTSNLDEFGKEQLETATSVAASFAKGLQAIASETADYSKKSIESNSAYVEKLLGAKSLDDAIQIQSEHAKSAYDGFVTQVYKLGELYSILAKEAFKPLKSVLAKVQAGEMLEEQQQRIVPSKPSRVATGSAAPSTN